MQYIKATLEKKSNIRCRYCISGEHINVDNEDLEIWLGNKVNLVERFCYFEILIGACVGMKDAKRVQVRSV